MLGLIEIAPARWGPTPGVEVKSGSESSERLTLAEEPRILKPLTCFLNSAERHCASIIFKNVRLGSIPETITLASISSPDASTTP
jgi:hypothetical protein